jgi:hypothetical protein
MLLRLLWRSGAGVISTSMLSLQCSIILQQVRGPSWQLPHIPQPLPTIPMMVGNVMVQKAGETSGAKSCQVSCALEHALVAAQHGIRVVPVEAEVLVQQALELPHEVPHQCCHLLLPGGQQSDVRLLISSGGTTLR